MTELEEIIRGRITSEGPLTFKAFMEMALYYPKIGYYNQAFDRIGKSGDFYTAANVSKIYGQTIALRLRELKDELSSGVFTIIEFGAGTGQLAFDILSELKSDSDFQSLSYVIVEKSPDFKLRQIKMLENFADNVSWSDLDQLTDKDIRGVVIQNEVIDAFAVHRLSQRAGNLKEIYVDFTGQFLEVENELSDSRLNNYFQNYADNSLDWQVAEVNLEALDWLEKIDTFLKNGFIITIDYGAKAGELYSPARMDGTLTCYYKHKISESPYQNIGEQDITAHVNFTALIKRGDELGIRTVEMKTQSNFLLTHGIIEILEIIQADKSVSELEKLKARQSVKSLVMPNSFGERFRVLVQKK